jgi:hypothetical protein
MNRNETSAIAVVSGWVAGDSVNSVRRRQRTSAMCAHIYDFRTAAAALIVLVYRVGELAHYEK